MIQEIIYTSAESGLRSGSRGFCTVVCTSGIDARTTERLEGLSGYRHAFLLNDPNSHLNPVNYSHLTMKLGTKTVHVLSRVADAGPDYTGRTNKIAHHMTLGTPTSPEGPARVFHTGAMVEKWDGQCKKIPPREFPTATVLTPIKLSAWANTTGDNGYAGYVAEELLRDSRQFTIIFNPGADLLGLVTEVLDCVPPGRRWKITFSTYFTRPIAGTKCQLCFVLNNTAEAKSLRNNANARKLDLTQQLGPANGGPLTEMARSGFVDHSVVRDSSMTAAVARGKGLAAAKDRKLPPEQGARTVPDLFAARKSLATQEKTPAAVKWASIALAASVLVGAIAFGVYQGTKPGKGFKVADTNVVPVQPEKAKSESSGGVFKPATTVKDDKVDPPEAIEPANTDVIQEAAKPKPSAYVFADELRDSLRITQGIPEYTIPKPIRAKSAFSIPLGPQVNEGLEIELIATDGLLEPLKKNRNEWLLRRLGTFGKSLVGTISLSDNMLKYQAAQQADDAKAASQGLLRLKFGGQTGIIRLGIPKRQPAFNLEWAVTSDLNSSEIRETGRLAVAPSIDIRVFENGKLVKDEEEPAALPELASLQSERFRNAAHGTSDRFIRTSFRPSMDREGWLDTPKTFLRNHVGDLYSYDQLEITVVPDDRDLVLQVRLRQFVACPQLSTDRKDRTLPTLSKINTWSIPKKRTYVTIGQFKNHMLEERVDFSSWGERLLEMAQPRYQDASILVSGRTQLKKVRQSMANIEHLVGEYARLYGIGNRDQRRANVAPRQIQNALRVLNKTLRETWDGEPSALQNQVNKNRRRFENYRVEAQVYYRAKDSSGAEHRIVVAEWKDED